MNKNNIVLTGLMGAGKTTIGKALAENTGFKFVDIDAEIVKQEQMSINDIFATKSEEYFRQIETEIIEKITQKNNQVISIGGGAFEKEVNRELLLTSCKVVYLQADVDTLFERIKTDNSRPLLQCDNPKDKLEELLKKREVNYKKAHYIIDTEKKTKEDITKEILEKI